MEDEEESSEMLMNAMRQNRPQRAGRNTRPALIEDDDEDDDSDFNDTKMYGGDDDSY